MISVAAYCRVSTDGADQANSFAAQKRYFRQYIEAREDWELFDIYADEGITGTSTKRRVQFNRMLDDARAGKFQFLLTKEVSRFARNILDAIAYTRELKALGIGVIFMTDGINTMDADAELRLSILSSMAQEESRRTSQRVKWGQTRQMERGVVFGHSLLGYKVHRGALTIEPQGAELVQMIFQRYGLEQKSSIAIAQELEQITGENWYAAKVLRILKNEKYVGDLVQKKTYTPDYLTHEKKQNRGEEPLVVLRNHHPPIVSRPLWDAVQMELKNKNRQKSGRDYRSSQYAFSGKIICGQCGSAFVSRIKRRKDGSICRRWCCVNCGMGKSLRDSLAKEAFFKVLSTLVTENTIINCVVEAAMLASVQAIEEAQKQKDIQHRKIIQKINRILELDSLNHLPAEEFGQVFDKYLIQLKQVEQTAAEIPKREFLVEKISDIFSGRAESDIFIRSLLDRITIFPDRHLELRLQSLEHVWHFDFV